MILENLMLRFFTLPLIDSHFYDVPGLASEPPHGENPLLGFSDYIRKGKEKMLLSIRFTSALASGSVLAFIGALLVVLSGCYQTTVFWEKSGSGEAEFQGATEECQALQRAAGVEEWRIHRCLEAKGWVQKREFGEEHPVE